MKSVLISIQPYWVFLIIAKAMGWKVDKEKTIEVRKNLPKDENWDKTVKIYCSKDRRSFSMIPKEYQPAMRGLLGKVVGEFVCPLIDRYEFDWCDHPELGISGDGGDNWYCIDDDDLKKTCIPEIEFYAYGSREDLYGWHIADLKLYDDPKPLWKFMKCGAPTEDELNDELCSYCEETEWGTRAVYGTPNGCVMCEGAFCGKAYSFYLDEHFVLKRPPQSWCYVEELKDDG